MVFAPEVLRAWMGPAFSQASSIILVLLAAWGAISSSSSVAYFILNATGQERTNTWLGGASSAVLLATSMSLIPIWGPIGAAIGRLATIAVSVVTRSIVQVRIMDDPRWYAGVMTLMPVAAGLVVTLPILSFYGETLNGSILLKLMIYLLSSLLCAFFITRIYGRGCFRSVKLPQLLAAKSG